MEENKENKDAENLENQDESQESQKKPETSDSSQSPEPVDSSQSSEPEESSERTEPEKSPQPTQPAEPAPPSQPTEPSVSSEEIEDEDTVTVKSVAKKYGLYAGLIFIVYGLIQQFAGLAANNAVNYLSYIILIAAIVLAHNEFKKEGNGFMSFKQGFNIGALITIFSALISIIFSYIYVKFIDDSLLTIVKEQQIEQLESQGLSQEQMDQAMQFSSSFMTPEFIMAMALIVTIIFGIILSLIISAVTRKDDPSLEV